MNHNKVLKQFFEQCPTISIDSWKAGCKHKLEFFFVVQLGYYGGATPNCEPYDFDGKILTPKDHIEIYQPYTMMVKFAGHSMNYAYDENPVTKLLNSNAVKKVLADCIGLAKNAVNSCNARTWYCDIRIQSMYTGNVLYKKSIEKGEI